MAELAADRAQNPEVTSLADEIRSAQEPEIAQLIGLPNAWDAEVPATGSVAGMGHSNMSGTPAMPGALRPEQMEELRNATGAGFDQMFLTSRSWRTRTPRSAACSSCRPADRHPMITVG